MQKDKKTCWSGVRNYQAANNMKAMAIGDLCFFYHSNEGKEIVGIFKVSKLYNPDHSDEAGKFGMVEVTAVEPMPRPVTLEEVRATPALKGMAFVRQSRLSVSPVTAAEWKAVCRLGGL